MIGVYCSYWSLIQKVDKKHQFPSGKDEIVRQWRHQDYIRRQETGNTGDHRAETDANAPDVSRIQLAHCHILCRKGDNDGKLAAE